MEFGGLTWCEALLQMLLVEGLFVAGIVAFVFGGVHGSNMQLFVLTSCHGIVECASLSAGPRCSYIVVV